MINNPISLAKLKQQPPHAIDKEDLIYLLENVLQKSRAFIYTNNEYVLTSQQYEKLLDYCWQRSMGKPIAYILGKKEFWKQTLTVNVATLIPRPETELLVEWVLQTFANTQTPLNILELGTGSGAIAIALAAEKPHWQLTATDINPTTLNTAKNNAKHYGLNNIYFLESDWFCGLTSKKFDVIISNPPYIAEGDPHLADLPFEPKIALTAGDEGLDALQHIITTAPAYLKKNGILILEHGYDQRSKLIALFESQHFQSIQTLDDYQSLPRVIIGKLYR